MNIQVKTFQIFIALTLGFFVSVSSHAENYDAGDTYHSKPVVVVRTFEAYGDSEGLLKLLDKGFKMAKKANPKSKSKTEVTIGNVGGRYANLVTIRTTYPNWDAFGRAKKANEARPEMKELQAEMSEGGYKVVETSFNTLVKTY